MPRVSVVGTTRRRFAPTVRGYIGAFCIVIATPIGLYACVASFSRAMKEWGYLLPPLLAVVFLVLGIIILSIVGVYLGFYVGLASGMVLDKLVGTLIRDRFRCRECGHSFKV